MPRRVRRLLKKRGRATRLPFVCVENLNLRATALFCSLAIPFGKFGIALQQRCDFTG